MEEKKYERKLIKGLRKAGFYATHIDCSVPGFPDIFAIYNGSVVLIETKDAGRGRSIFEASQPPFYYDISHTGGFCNLFIARCNSSGCSLSIVQFKDATPVVTQIYEADSYYEVAVYIGTII